MVAVFQGCFLEQFLICDMGSCRRPDSRACALNTAVDCVYFRWGEGGLWSCPRQDLVRCFSVVGGPSCFQWPLVVSVRGCSHCFHSAFGFFRDSTVWWLFGFLALEETISWLARDLPLQVTSWEAKGKSTCCCCWEESSKTFLWEGKCLVYCCHLLLVLTVMQEILIL